MFKSSRFAIILAFSLILSAMVFAYAASNTVPATSAGDGSAAITGYTVGNVKYNLNATNPQVFESVQFTLTGASAPSTVKIKLVSGGSTWYDCTLATGTWTCPTTATVLSADQLTVVAVE
ncbi:MAG: hypothetical protein HPY76_01330 [Anaerolineae bacterium]|nr:hypothetical protein [Anaerolineae bacterium]